eukprot:NODE_648_length_2506_cov_62.896349_g555_i0.p1 GENE.NODE_648_length_2506_cov_62.896349_g555_i0~~NODE_648_length_2506_cov_62.896349_g555_i0.p1  ORF type:complete len:783 (-),score=86.09 NODE_648_length_2506_cov_62.896349_g555_i0:158-2167(-)
MSGPKICILCPTYCHDQLCLAINRLDCRGNWSTCRWKESQCLYYNCMDRRNLHQVLNTSESLEFWKEIQRYHLHMCQTTTTTKFSKATMHGFSTSTFNPPSGRLSFEIKDHLKDGDEAWIFVNQELMEIKCRLTTCPIDIAFPLDKPSTLLFWTSIGHSYEGVIWCGADTLAVKVIGSNGQPVHKAKVSANVQMVEETKFTNMDGVAVFYNLPKITILITISNGERIKATGVAVGLQSSLTVPLYVEDAPEHSLNTELVNMANWKLSHELVAKVNQDQIVLTTKGHGEVTASRTFISHMTGHYKILYKFTTREYPQYFRTQYDDCFAVSIEVVGGQISHVANKMNNLGELNLLRKIYDSSSGITQGETSLGELSVPVKKGDKVKIFASVSNVGDGAIDSSIYLHTPIICNIVVSAFEAFDLNGEPLRFIGLDKHTYFGGNTRIRTKILIEGSKGLKINKAKVEAINDGKVLTTGHIKLLTEIPQNGVLKGEFIIELPSVKLDQAVETVELRLTIQTETNEKAEYSSPPYNVIVRAGVERFGGISEAVGGNDWVLPKVKKSLIKLFESTPGLQMGIGSNIYGGSLLPHELTKNGVGVQLRWPGYDLMDYATFSFIKLILEKSPEIKNVFVSYKKLGVFHSSLEREFINRVPARNIIHRMNGHDKYCIFQF